MPPCKKRARPISVAQAVTGAGYHADRPDTAHVLAGRRVKVIALAAGFKSATANLISPSIAWSSIGPAPKSVQSADASRD
jgi:hypothetical protein